jgi:hypothetical protein
MHVWCAGTVTSGRVKHMLGMEVNPMATGLTRVHTTSGSRRNLGLGPRIHISEGVLSSFCPTCAGPLDGGAVIVGNQLCCSVECARQENRRGLSITIGHIDSQPWKAENVASRGGAPLNARPT